MSNIFLSYKREDVDKVARVVRLLEESGFQVWWDTNILPGERFASVIERELARAACVLVAWSHRAVGSDWVIDEATAGKGRGVLVAVSLDGAPPPIGFRQIQTEDLTSWAGDARDPRIQRVIAGVSQHAKPSRSPAQTPSMPPVDARAGPVILSAIAEHLQRDEPIIVFPVEVDGVAFHLRLRGRSEDEAVAAARRASDAGSFSSNQAYVQFVLRKWLEPNGDLATALVDHNSQHPDSRVSSPSDLLQLVLDRAVRSYQQIFSIPSRGDHRTPLGLQGATLPPRIAGAAHTSEGHAGAPFLQWNFQELFDYGSGSAGFWVTYFRISGVWTGSVPLTRITAQITSQVSGKSVALDFQIGPNERVATAQRVVDPGARFLLSAPIPSPAHAHGSHGYTAAEYLREVGAIEFRFEAEGVHFSRIFSLAEITAQVLAAEARLGPKPPPPSVRRAT